MENALFVVFIVFISQPLLFLILVVAIEIPRYTVGAVALAIRQLFPQSSLYIVETSISVIIPAYNKEASLEETVNSLIKSDTKIKEILVVNDGSSDDTNVLLGKLKNKFPQISVIHHVERMGKSASINHAANFAQGDLLLILDADTILESQSVSILASAFTNPEVGIASGDLIVSNSTENPLTAMQSLEYLMAISVGRYFLDHIGAIACCSGAFSMVRKTIFMDIGGYDVGPGEDLELTLRIRRAGYRARFVHHSVAYTKVPETPTKLFKQRQRWDRDALHIRIFQYKEFFPFVKPRGSMADILERLDFIYLGVMPIIIFLPYLIYIAFYYNDIFSTFMIGVYLILLPLYILNIFLAFLITKSSPTITQICVLPLMPIYQGYIMKLVSFYAFSSEMLVAASQVDTFVPLRVRQALYGKGANK